MMSQTRLIRAELTLLMRDTTFWGLVLLLFLLMTFSVWNAFQHLSAKRKQLDLQVEMVRENDLALIGQIDSLNQGLATYEEQYTLPTNGVRLTFNNHRLSWMPFEAFSLIAIGQGDIYSNYRKIILYFNDSYEMTSYELTSPVELLFGQLDLAFVWTYLLPLIILLISFDLLSREKETGRLKLILSHSPRTADWLLTKISIRFLTITSLIVVFTFILLVFFGVPIAEHWLEFTQLVTILFLYAAFWFVLSFLVNLFGYSSGNSLIVLTNTWVFFVFLVPSVVNQLGKELNPLSSRLEVINHHQAMYNDMERNLEEELKSLFQSHPDWASDDPITKDMSNSTGWNINYLAKQYIAQLKHQPKAQEYENIVDRRNQWFGRFRILSPALVFQHALTDLAGTSTRYYRNFLHQSQGYAHRYRQYVFKRLFTNHAFTSDEIRSLPRFEFDREELPALFLLDALILLAYLLLAGTTIFTFIKTNTLVN